MDGVRSLLTPKTIMQNTISSPYVSSEYQTRQKLWRLIYQNKAPWLIPGKVYSANIGATLSSEIARYITINMLATVRNDITLNTLFQNEVLADIRNQVEYGLAFGGMIIKPYWTNGVVKITFAQPNEYELISVDSDGTILECYFKDYETIYVGGKYEYLVRVEHHLFDRQTGQYKIMNEVYRSDSIGSIDTKYGNTQAQLQRVPRWQGIQLEQLLSGVTQPMFGYFKPAVSNTIDTKSPYGVSLFDKAITSLEQADKQLSGLVREFKIKEGKLYVSQLALEGTERVNKRSGAKLPHLDDDFYVKLFTDDKQGDTFFEVFSPDIRSEDFLRVFNKYQQLVEDNVGLMHGTISSPDITDRTATEVREAKQKTHATVEANQKALERAFEGALYSMSYYMGNPQGSWELITQFDRSLVEDPVETLDQMREDVLSGLLRPELYLAKKYNITEEEALKRMPQGTQKIVDNRTKYVWTPVEFGFENGQSPPAQESV